MNSTICFIGAGNMSRSLIGGLIASGYPKEKLRATDPSTDICDYISQTFSIRCELDNTAVLNGSNIIVLAVKPQQLQAVCEDLSSKLAPNLSKPLIISIAAGVRSADIQRWLADDYAVVRTMPNTPALVQAGATGMFATPQVSAPQRNDAENILRAAGLILWVKEESQLDAVTALSGSGPAYYFLFMEAMEAAGQKLGLDAKTAHLLSLQTAFGAAKMALESNDDCATLRHKVTSPNGTTERAIQSFEADQLTASVERAMQAAFERSQQLAQQLGGQA